MFSARNVIVMISTKGTVYTYRIYYGPNFVTKMSGAGALSLCTVCMYVRLTFGYIKTLHLAPFLWRNKSYNYWSSYVDTSWWVSDIVLKITLLWPTFSTWLGLGRGYIHVLKHYLVYSKFISRHQLLILIRGNLCERLCFAN